MNRIFLTVLACSLLTAQLVGSQGGSARGRAGATDRDDQG